MSNKVKKGGRQKSNEKLKRYKRSKIDRHGRKKAFYLFSAMSETWFASNTDSKVAPNDFLSWCFIFPEKKSNQF